MKVHWFVVTALFLSGCASPGENVGICRVFAEVGGNAEALGLVRLPGDLAASLRQQLPAADRSGYPCGYTAGDQLILAQRSNPDSFIYGYRFAKRGDNWQLVEDTPEILAVPHVIE